MNIQLQPICFNKDGEMIAILGESCGGEKIVKLNDKGELLATRNCCGDMCIFGRALYMESLLSLPSE